MAIIYFGPYQLAYMHQKVAFALLPRGGGGGGGWGV